MAGSEHAEDHQRGRCNAASAKNNQVISIYVLSCAVLSCSIGHYLRLPKLVAATITAPSRDAVQAMHPRAGSFGSSALAQEPWLRTSDLVPGIW